MALCDAENDSFPKVWTSLVPLRIGKEARRVGQGIVIDCSAIRATLLDVITGGISIRHEIHVRNN